MGVKHCAWGTCTSDSREKEKEHMRNVKFYSFHKPDLQNDFCEKTIRCRNWIKACGRPHSQLNLQKIEQDYKKYRYYYVVCASFNHRGASFNHQDAKCSSIHLEQSTIPSGLAPRIAFCELMIALYL